MNFMKAIVAAGLVAASTSAFAADITGAGSTFIFPVLSKWADAYKKESGSGVNYQSIGSGAGIKQIQAKTVTFGATDAPLKFETLEKDGLIQWPQVMGAIDVAPVQNTSLVRIGYTATKPRFAQKMAEAVADSYMRMNVEKKLDAGALPDFLSETKHIRDGDWRVAPAEPGSLRGGEQLAPVLGAHTGRLGRVDEIEDQVFRIADFGRAPTIDFCISPPTKTAIVGIDMIW